MAEKNENKVEILVRLTNGKNIHLVGQPGDRYVLNAVGEPAFEAPRKDNLVAVVAPDADNDETEGYETGSVWFDTVLRKWHRLGVAGAGVAEWDILN